MSRKTDIKRRDFLKATGAGATLVAGGVFSQLDAQESKAASGKLNIACIGTANRAAADISGVQGENIVALVDIDPQGSLGRWFMTRLETDEALVENLDFATSSAWGITYECRKLADGHDVVIVDTPPKADSDLRPALRAAATASRAAAAAEARPGAGDAGFFGVERRECRFRTVARGTGCPTTRFSNP